MRSILTLLCCAGFSCAPVIGAQADAPPVADPATAASVSVAEETAAPAMDAAGETRAEPAPDAAADADVAPSEDTAAESPPAASPAPTGTEAPAEDAAGATPAVESAPAAAENPAPVPAEVVATPTAAGDPESIALASIMERIWIAQHEREVALYHDTIRLVMTFGIAFAAVCLVGLVAAALLNYRALVAVQNALERVAATDVESPSRGLLPPRAAAALAPTAGMERIHKSGRRFQSRMSSLEQRLAELENLAGRAGAEHADGSAGDAGATVVPVDLPANGGLPAEAVSPVPRRAIPRAMILVHKAQAQMNLGKLAEALQSVDEAAQLDARKAEVHITRGQVLEKMGRLPDALQAYETAVGVDEANPSALLMKAGVLNRQEKFAEALACYEQALAVHRAQL